MSVRKKFSGEALRAMRLRAGLTTRQLSEKSGLAISTLEKFEGGVTNYIADVTLIGLAQAFACDVMELEEKLGVEVPAVPPAPQV